MSETRIAPGVGRVVWYYNELGAIAQAAMITYVLSEGDDTAGDVVSLCVFGYSGLPRPRTPVCLVQPGEDPPEGEHCTWMPDQIGQAAKTEELQAALDGKLDATKYGGPIRGMRAEVDALPPDAKSCTLNDTPRPTLREQIAAELAEAKARVKKLESLCDYLDRHPVLNFIDKGIAARGGTLSLYTY